MTGKEIKNGRRKVLKLMLRDVGLAGLGGIVWGTTATRLKASELTLRPPGALDEEDFLKACIRCGNCVEACPYDTLKLADIDDHASTGTPFFKPRTVPCYMCPDVPCLPVCPSGALDAALIPKEEAHEKEAIPDIEKARMGIAVIDQESCLAYWGIQCDACYRACPLMGKAITLEMRRNRRTGKHALLEPVVHNDVCTGCGMCEHACVTEKAAIFVLPREVATGKVGKHYIKGWEREDEKRLEGKQEETEKKSKPEDILNDWESLFGDD